MMQFVYSVFDRKAKLFGALMFFQNGDMAKRACADLMRVGGDTPMHHYPDDFDMYLVGEFNDELGMISGYGAPELICRFGDFVEKK